MEFSSPTDELFPWSPDGLPPVLHPPPTGSSTSAHLKRNHLPHSALCEGDSGYMSVSPASGGRAGKKSSTGLFLSTPELAGTVGGGECSSGELYTPAAVKLKTDPTRKRILQTYPLTSSEERPCSSSSRCLLSTSPPTSTSADISDLMETSLYQEEPMDFSLVPSNSQLDIIIEENLNVSEISRKFSSDLSSNSLISKPVTPIICATPCDRLYRKTSSHKSSRSSPRKKKLFFKKKLPRPGAMIGADHIDFFAHLGVRANFMFIAWKIFDMLSSEDIWNVTMVSKTWRSLCLGYPRANEKWLAYVADRKLQKENLPTNMFGKAAKNVGCELSSLNSGGSSSPFSLRQPVSPPVSPTKFRFHLFQKEASRLKEDEKLTDCPRCSLPSIVSPAARLGRCTRHGCGLEFCSTCKSPFHGSRPCKTSTPASPQRVRPVRRGLIGTRESRRFLRRL